MSITTTTATTAGSVEKEGDEEYSDIEDEDEGGESADQECEDYDDSYYDIAEQEMIERKEYKEAEMYLRRTANRQQSLIEGLRKQFDVFSQQRDVLRHMAVSLHEQCQKLLDENKKLRAEHGVTVEMSRLLEENYELKRRSKETMELYAEAIEPQQEKRDVQEPETEYVTRLGIQFTHVGRKVVKQESFDIDPIMEENEEYAAQNSKLMLKIKELTERNMAMGKSQIHLEDENSELSYAVQELQQMVTKYEPRLSAEKQENIAQRQVNSQLAQRNRQLEEQLRTMSACAGSSALGTGEQSLMDRARGTPGMFGLPSVHVTLSVTQS